jgi:DeoR/GlpR family transcriptional regulator of sugar metabolism
MKKTERWEIIKQECQKRTSLSIRDACKLLPDMSVALIRRDFQGLAAGNPQINWVPGRRGTPGRIAWDIRAQFDPSVRLHTAVDEKKKIAEVAARFVRVADKIFVDNGSTLEILIEYAIEHDLLRELTRVYTTSLDIAVRLVEWQRAERVPELGYVIGGQIRTVSRGLIGDEGWKMLPRSQQFDVAFIGAPGIDKSGFLSISQRGAESKMQAIARANTVVLLADHSKFDQEKINTLFEGLARSYFGRFEGEPSCKGFYLLSDDKLSDADRKSLEAAGVIVYTNNTLPEEIRLSMRSKYQADT